MSINPLIVKRLLYRDTSITLNQSLTFASLIKSEHMFVSIDECLEYLQFICIPKEKDPDFFLSFQKKLLFANTIKESIGTLFYESYKTLENHNVNDLLIIKDKIQRFTDSALNTIRDEYDTNTVHIIKVLSSFLSIISLICKKENSRYEVFPPFSDVSKLYYGLMQDVYLYLSKGIDSEYFLNYTRIYAKYILNSDKEKTRMGVSDYFTEGDSKNGKRQH